MFFERRTGHPRSQRTDDSSVELDRTRRRNLDRPLDVGGDSLNISVGRHREPAGHLALLHPASARMGIKQISRLMIYYLAQFLHGCFANSRKLFLEDPR